MSDEDHPSVDAAPEKASDRLSPVSERQRLASLDVLRGIAVLGILSMNIAAFALPLSAYWNPLRQGGFEGIDKLEWVATHVLAEMKFMTIFSALFGAGLALMATRAQLSGKEYGLSYLRRNAWLAVIGLAHGIFLWWGDVLFQYAVCGLLIFPLRKLRPTTLIVIGLLVVSAAIPINDVLGSELEKLRHQAQQAEAKETSGIDLSAEERSAVAEWNEQRALLLPSPKQLEVEVTTFRGGYLQILAFRAPLAVDFMISGLISTVLWRAGGLMLIGMALMKLGFFSAQLSNRRYLQLLCAGYLVGLPLSAFSASELIRNQFDMFYLLQGGVIWNYAGSLFVALGHASAVMLACRNLKGPLLRMLGATGRMALSNYLLQSLICTTVFYGYGLAMYGHLSRSQLAGAAAAIWVFQLLLSDWWLKRFRFGPAEWAWRSLTYWRLQPLRRA